MSVFVYIKFYILSSDIFVYICMYMQIKYKFELPVEKLGFSSVATLVNSISDVIKKVIQSGACLCVCMCVCAHVHMCVCVSLCESELQCYFCDLQVSCL